MALIQVTLSLVIKSW